MTTVTVCVELVEPQRAWVGSALEGARAAAIAFCIRRWAGAGNCGSTETVVVVGMSMGGISGDTLGQEMSSCEDIFA